MKPTKISVGYVAKRVPVPNEATEAEAYAIYAVGGEAKTGAAWNGHEFEICDISVYNINNEGWHFNIYEGGGYQEQARSREEIMILHYPLDPRADKTDWAGAIEAYENEDGDGWLPRHCDADYHRDHEDILEAVIVGQFQPVINSLMLDAQTKLRTLMRTPDDSSAGSRELAARLKADAMLSVCDHLVKCAKKDAREKHLGYYHQYPEHSHYAQEILDCMNRYIFISKFTQSADYLKVSSEVQGIYDKMAETHTYETSWEKRARVKAEAARREAERESSD